ncbi:Tic20 family protein [Aphanothece sacrum]|uniref:Uncharacterized protein n=1 Tax=Aphanothece sacrum FPU1 TaxID=1920663 RepID=A0A401IN61_APHSA|nr:Tic20 family protein [Aphanothece sacrum]GBF82681.1 hypothetical protein AsFPU1_4114 [Aphanothece sacrum FPU1]GBF84527.1 hypothetical protein AsFPU3_1577 [Aphanothece sacrum FPU3]
MTWRGSADIKDRIFGTLVYCFAIFDTISFSVFLVSQFPVFGFFLIPAFPVGFLYGLIGQTLGPLGNWGSFIVFLILFFVVVRNEKISHFIRYNTMQTILIGILLALFQIIIETLMPALGQGGLLIETLFNVVFLGGIAACYYCMVQSVLGRYAEIPTISEAAYSQVR